MSIGPRLSSTSQPSIPQASFVAYIGLALHAEGDTDYRFLSPLIAREAEAICLRRAIVTVEIGGPFSLRQAVRRSEHARHEAIAEASEPYDIVCVHADGAGDFALAHASNVTPVGDAAARRGFRSKAVGVVPIREMEAWSLVDGDAIRAVTGSSRSDNDLGLPRSIEIEGIADPKAVLQDVLTAAVGDRRRARRDALAYFVLLGERIDLAKSLQLPSYRRFATALATAIDGLGLLA